MTDKYEAPSNKIFEEIKQKSIDIWNTYSDAHGYRSEKLNRIKNVKNVKDNWRVFYGMFDWQNQTKLLMYLSQEANEFIENHL